MTTEQHELLELLSCSLFSIPHQPPKLSKLIISEAINHSVLPIITSIADDASYDNLSMLQLAKNLQVMYAHAELHEIFTTNDIPYVILKGSASAAYYPNPNVRVLGDVDFYTTEVERASAVLEEVGFIPLEDQEHIFHQVYHRDHISVELHWGIPGVPKGRNDVQVLFDDLIERSVIAHTDLGDIRVPSVFHHGLIILLHMASHMINSGIGLRHLCDWAVVIGTGKNFHIFHKNRLNRASRV